MGSDRTVFPVSLALALGFDPLEAAIRTASGWSGIGLIFVYSVLISFALPLPSEVVLYPLGYFESTQAMALGLPFGAELAIVFAASGLGKALGSVFALAIGHNASHSGIVVRTLERMGFDPIGWSEHKVAILVKRWGYVGLAIGLSVPFFPDTLSIYAFSILEDDYRKFAAAAFAGTIGRLSITILIIEGTLFVV
ncbi:MAG: hypothetical protein ABEJ77_00955 [Halanaeroarchaeum sp.]